MSNEEAEALMERIASKDSKRERQAFIHRMERKLGRKERYSRG